MTRRIGLVILALVVLVVVGYQLRSRQAAPGVKVTLKNFGRDRRYPIVNRFRDSGAALPTHDRSLLKSGAAATKSEAFDF